MKHTKEPWAVDYREAVDESGKTWIAYAEDDTTMVEGLSEFHLRHAVNRVNACAGMGPMQPGSVKKLVDAARALRKEYHDIMWNEFSETHDKETDDFDAALAELGGRP